MEIFPSAGNKTSGMARHEERKFSTGNEPFTLAHHPSLQNCPHPPTEGFQPQEGCEVLVKSNNSPMSSPRLEHFGHLWALVPRSTGVEVGSRVREETGEESILDRHLFQFPA